MIEKEFKFRIPQNDYLKLRRFYRDSPTKIQINHYFDSPSLYLIRHGVGLRIRESGGKFTLTLKTSRSTRRNKSGWSERNEWEVTVKPSLLERMKRTFPVEILPANIAGKLKRAVPKLDDSLGYLGKMRTSRTKIQFNHCLFELDKSGVKKNQFFELEAEGSNAKKLKINLDEFFDIHRIKARPEPRSKLQRFVSSLKTKKG